MNRAAFALRHELIPGDVGAIVQQHGAVYAREHKFDLRFEAYVAGPLADLVIDPNPRSRVWIAETNYKFAGCAAVVERTDTEALFRWFLVLPEYRGKGLGQWLLDEALAYARDQKYETVSLWTVDLLRDAARLYVEAGFRLAEEKPGAPWGVQLTEQKYVLNLLG